MITIWGRTDSSNVQATLWALTELGLPFERIDAGQRFGVTDTPAFRAMNPNGTIPVLCDGDNPPLWETGAILRYLANAYGAAPFWPDELIARTEIDRWAEWAKVTIAVNFTVPIFWRVVRTPAADRDTDAIDAATAALDDRLAIADARLATHPFIAGDDFTLADIQLGHILYRYFDIPIPRRPLPALRDYYDRLTTRPAYRETVMVSYEALRA
ncbi:glutathione S-transferase family protein [Cognatishimia sp. F0-27]|uniref:glutathione S-transferase family protein n=1 Tax=Cognatishimia sp. F0-27 TaxID=2816855 RepID=UPI001D0C522E|nr:glutathione S-transferase family protein [Cognatishimia sp. F0-27]MCC1494573.1 glutathione S-transferase family protein [Cognatishimia sp. F0-27]